MNHPLALLRSHCCTQSLIHHLALSVCFREGFVSGGVDVTFTAAVPVKFPATVGTAEEHIPDTMTLRHVLHGTLSATQVELRQRLQLTDGVRQPLKGGAAVQVELRQGLQLTEGVREPPNGGAVSQVELCQGPQVTDGVR